MTVHDAKIQAFADCVRGAMSAPDYEPLEAAIEFARSMANGQLDSAQMAEAEAEVRRRVAGELEDR